MCLKVQWLLPRARQRPVLLAELWALGTRGMGRSPSLRDPTGWLMGGWMQKEKRREGAGEGLKWAGPGTSPSARSQRCWGLAWFFWDHMGKPRLTLGPLSSGSLPVLPLSALSAY